MSEQQYALHSHIIFALPRKLGRSLTYPLNPMHGDIAVVDRQYQKNLHGYYLVKKLTYPSRKPPSRPSTISVSMGKKYGDGVCKKSFVDLMDWLYVWYGQIKPGYLIPNQDNMKAMYNVKDLLEIMFDHMETGQ